MRSCLFVCSLFISFSLSVNLPIMSSLDSSDNLYVFSCTDCDFTSVKEGSLGVHRAKMHNVELADQVLSVYVTRVYPECKKFKCCICDVVIGSYSNFKRHFDNRDPNIELSADAICSICNMEFQNAKAVGVHCQRVHNISKEKPNKHIPSSPTPIQSFIYKWKPFNHSPPDIPSQLPSQPPSPISLLITGRFLSSASIIYPLFVTSPYSPTIMFPIVC